MTLAAAATIVSSAVLIALFDDGVYRFGATLAIVTAVLVVAFDRRVPYAMGLVTAATACMPVLIWRASPDLQALHRRSTRWHGPVPRQPADCWRCRPSSTR